MSYLTTEKHTEDYLPKPYMAVGGGGALLRKMVYYYIRKNDYAQPKAVYNNKLESIRTQSFRLHSSRTGLGTILFSNDRVYSLSAPVEQEMCTSIRCSPTATFGFDFYELAGTG